MSKFMISFGARAMDHVPDDDMPAVAEAARAVVFKILNAGAYVHAGGLGNRTASIVATDGTATDGPEPEVVSGMTMSKFFQKKRRWLGRRRLLSHAVVRKKSGILDVMSSLVVGHVESTTDIG